MTLPQNYCKCIQHSTETISPWTMQISSLQINWHMHACTARGGISTPNLATAQRGILEQYFYVHCFDSFIHIPGQQVVAAKCRRSLSPLQSTRQPQGQNLGSMVVYWQNHQPSHKVGRRPTNSEQNTAYDSQLHSLWVNTTYSEPQSALPHHSSMPAFLLPCCRVFLFGDTTTQLRSIM
jgi:hypothetical protein